MLRTSMLPSALIIVCLLIATESTEAEAPVADGASLATMECGPQELRERLPELDPVGPTQVEGRFDVVATGFEHTCAVERTDTTLAGLRCWGGGTSGKLGTGSTDDVQEPAQPMLFPAP